MAIRTDSWQRVTDFSAVELPRVKRQKPANRGLSQPTRPARTEAEIVAARFRACTSAWHRRQSGPRSSPEVAWPGDRDRVYRNLRRPGDWHYEASSGGWWGSRMRKRLPRPTTLSTSIVPPWSRTTP